MKYLFLRMNIGLMSLIGATIICMALLLSPHLTLALIHAHPSVGLGIAMLPLHVHAAALAKFGVLAMALAPAPKSQSVPTTWFGRALYYVQNFIGHDAFPFLSGLFSKIEMDSVAKLTPLAEQTIANIEAQVTPLLAQGPVGWLEAFHLTVANLWEGVQAAGGDVASIGMTDILTAAHAALVNLENKLGGKAAG